MKTKNNVRKTITKSLAVIISLVLISITVNAQDFWRSVFENNSLNQIAMVMSNEFASSASPAIAEASTGADAYAEYAIVETEEALEIENWMMNENAFFTNISVETEVENSLEVENWMTNESLFNGTAAYFSLENEADLEVEDWMKNTDYFGVVSIEIEEETDETLEVEDWMTNNKIWEN